MSDAMEFRKISAYSDAEHAEADDLLEGEHGYKWRILEGVVMPPYITPGRDGPAAVVQTKHWIVGQALAWFGISRRHAPRFECFSKTAGAFVHTAMTKLTEREPARFQYS